MDHCALMTGDDFLGVEVIALEFLRGRVVIGDVQSELLACRNLQFGGLEAVIFDREREVVGAGGRNDYQRNEQGKQQQAHVSSFGLMESATSLCPANAALARQDRFGKSSRGPARPDHAACNYSNEKVRHKELSRRGIPYLARRGRAFALRRSDARVSRFGATR